MMRDKKELWKLVNSITNWETLQRFSSKPFKPGFLDMVLSDNSEHATQFYSEEELTKIKKLKSQLGLGGGTSTTSEKNHNQRVIRESDEEMHSRSHSQVEVIKAENYQIQTQWVIRKRRTVPPKPFKPWGLDMKLSHKFYCEKELAQINKVFKLHSETTENTQTQTQSQRVTRKRRRIPIQDMLLDDDEEDEEDEAPPKPFKPCGLDVLFSETAPHFYCEKQLAQINKVFKLHSHSQVEASKPENNQSVTRKRRKIPNDEEEDEAPPKPTKKKSRKKIASENVQELPVEIRNRIADLNGTNTQFLMSKKLYITDVRANNNRLSMPENSIKCEFLTEAEKECTAEQLGMDVTVLDPSMREFSLVLKKWKMNSVFVYNLIKNWNRVVSENEFQEDQELQIWSFRVNTKLYFVLNKV